MNLGVQKVWPTPNTKLWGILLYDYGIWMGDVVDRYFH